MRHFSRGLKLNKILSIILMVLLAVGMAVIIVGLVKNRYIPAVIFVSGLYIILAAFLSLTVFIIPVFVCLWHGICICTKRCET